MDAFGLVLGHGAGMVHALWLRPNATVVEVGQPGDLANNYLARIAQVFGLRHVKVRCAAHEDASLGGSFFLPRAGGNAAGGCAAELKAVLRELVLEQTEAEEAANGF
mmetsp:Transcript_22762/g.51333  ORF Transcript_22762/g.51333 Transcript_22762/m.51333 type:complete len:107 (-) Transcript_22762:278-598(-)